MLVLYFKAITGSFQMAPCLEIFAIYVLVKFGKCRSKCTISLQFRAKRLYYCFISILRRTCSKSLATHIFTKWNVWPWGNGNASASHAKVRSTNPVSAALFLPSLSTDLIWTVKVRQISSFVHCMAESKLD